MPTWLDKILNSQFVMIGLAGLAFLIALWLVIVIVRMLTGGRLRFNGGRTRQARLGIVDAFDLDRQRQLIIVRRDNTEHLIMIGGPNDLVIESEIVRVEARETRRVSDKADGFADNRIAAPTMAVDAGRPTSEEPLLPMAMPPSALPEPQLAAQSPDAPPASVASTGADAPAPRTPTFPLPPRRPTPQPERRPPPVPESVTRGDEPLRPAAPPMAAEPPPPLPPPAPLPPAPLPPAPLPPAIEAPAAIETFPSPPPIPPEPLPPIVPTQGSDLPPRPPLRSPPPSFLKPLPPRPPIRPLRRATPVVPGAPAPASQPPAPPAPPTAIPQAEIAPPPAVEPVAPPVVAPPVPIHHPEPASPPAAETGPQEASHPEAKSEEPNALESLEEEMAKLLGRG